MTNARDRDKVMEEDKMYWTCVETYSGSGRVSRMWVEENANRPDAWIPCNDNNECELMGRKGSACGDDNQHVPYPFNGMGGQVIAGPFPTMKEAEDAYPYDE
jgi:hypothetical protein